MIARVMEGFVLSFVCFCVAGSLTVSTIQVQEDYDVQLVNTDAPKPELENEIKASYGGASLGNFGVEARLKRVAVLEQDTPVRQVDSRFKHAEVYGKSPGDGIYWKDNVETQRLGHGEATVTRVIHHGIYPSLNVTEPVGRTNWTSRFTKSRTKRDWLGGKGGTSSTKVDYRYETTGSSNGTYRRETSVQVKDGPRIVNERKNSQNDTTYTRYEAHYPPNNASRQHYDAKNRNPPPKITKSRNKRDWFGGKARSSTTRVDYRVDSTSSSNGTYHRETSLQVNDGPRTVYDTRNRQDDTTFTKHEAHYPPNNENRRYGAVNVQNTTPRVISYRYDSTGRSDGSYHRETSFQVKDGPRTVYDTRNRQDETTFTRYDARYPPNNDNRQRYDVASLRNPPSKISKFRRKRDWFGGNTRSSSTKIENRVESASSSNGTYHRETSFQVKDGPRTVYDGRSGQNDTTYARHEAHYPEYNDNRYDAKNVQNTTPIVNYMFDSTGSSNVTFHREASSQVKAGPRTVHDTRNSQNETTYASYEDHYPPTDNNQRYNANVQNTTPRVTKYVRARRHSGFGASRREEYRYNSTGSSNGTFHRQTSIQLNNGNGSAYSGWDNQNGTIKTTYQAHYPPHNSSTNLQNPHDFMRNFSYARAIHPANGSRDHSFYTHQFLPPITNKTNSTATYRTLYFPASNSVDTFIDNRKYTNNKGNVRLISVGYYSVNESRDGVRSYYNPSVNDRNDYRESPRTNGFEPTRYRRDTSKSLGWLDRLFLTIGLAKLNNEQNEIPAGSETVKLEVSDGGNAVLQNHYGYSSNGHHHLEPTQIDRIYLVGGASPTSAVPTPVAAAVGTLMERVTSDVTSYEDVSSSSEELPSLPDESLQDLQPATAVLSFSEGPRTKEVLIQAPPRVINCKPPKRLARGRCRTVTALRERNLDNTSSWFRAV